MLAPARIEIALVEVDVIVLEKNRQQILEVLNLIGRVAHEVPKILRARQPRKRLDEVLVENVFLLRILIRHILFHLGKTQIHLRRQRLIKNFLQELVDGAQLALESDLIHIITHPFASTIRATTTSNLSLSCDILSI